MKINNNVILFDNDTKGGRINPDKIENAIVIKMGFKSNSRIFNFFWGICKYLIRRTYEVDEAFREFEDRYE